VTEQPSERQVGAAGSVLLRMRRPRSLGDLPVLPIAVVLVAVALSILTPSFLTKSNLENVGRQSAFLALLTFGQLFPVLSGGFDISVGFVVAFTTVVTATTVLQYGLVPGIVAGILFAAIFASLSGFIVARFSVSAFVVTLGAAQVARGGALMFTNGQVIYGLPTDFKQIGIGFIGPIPTPLAIAAIAFVACWFLLNRTVYGRYLYAIGGNEEAARLAGINVRLHKMLAYTINGILVGVAAVVLTARVGAAESNLGLGSELEAIAAVVIGGVALSGGRGGIWNALLGVITLSLISNGLNLLGVSSYLQLVVAGVIIVGAVLLDRLRASSARR
jgi:ribose transport system permease protein